MATYGLTPKSFDGVTLPAGDAAYHFHFVDDSQTLDSVGATAVKSTRPGRTPLRAYVQPDGMQIVLETVIDEVSQNNNDFLKGLFNTIEGAEHTLIVTDGNSVDRQIACTVQKWVVAQGLGNIVFKVALDCPSGVWESVTPASATPLELDTPTDTFELPNAGNTPAPVVLTLEPQAGIDIADSSSLAKRIWLANQSEQPLTHFAAEGYAIEITGGGIDTTALTLLASLDDLRVWLNGRELLRWCDPATENAATKIWCNIAMRPGKFATLAAAIDTDDTVIVADSIDGFAGWDREGWMFIGVEPVIYSLADDGYTATITRIAGATGHSAGDVITWIEHYLTLTYGFNAALAPPAGLDAKPVIDLAASSNVLHEWPGPFLNDNDRRSMTLRRIVEGEGSEHVRGWDDGDDLLFEDSLPETGKPLADQVELRFPVPALGPIVLDWQVDKTMMLQGFVADLQGNESLLIEEIVAGTGTAESYALTNDATRLRLKAKIAAIAGDLDEAEITGSAVLNPGTVGHNITDYQGGDGTTPITVSATIYRGITFTLDEATEIYGFAARFTAAGTVTYEIRSSDLNIILATGHFVTLVNEVVISTQVPFALPAGDYVMVLENDAGPDLAIRSRNLANIYVVQVLKPSDPVTPTTLDSGGDHVITVREVDYPNISTDIAGGPIFAVLSKKAEPQSDAPTETGNVVSIDNLSVPLDPDKAPLILIGPEFACFPLIGTLTNNETDQQATLSFICKAGQSLTLDCDSGAVTDDETGLEACYAVEYGDPVKRIQVASGVNEFEIAIAGVAVAAELHVTPTYRQAWL